MHPWSVLLPNVKLLCSTKFGVWSKGPRLNEIPILFPRKFSFHYKYIRIMQSQRFLINYKFLTNCRHLYQLLLLHNGAKVDMNSHQNLINISKGSPSCKYHHKRLINHLKKKCHFKESNRTQSKKCSTSSTEFSKMWLHHIAADRLQYRDILFLLCCFTQPELRNQAQRA